LAARFYAHKDQAPQLSFPTGAYTQVTWPAVMLDTNLYFDTTNNWWTPPAGCVALHSSIWQTAHAASTGTPTFVAKIRRFHSGITISNASPAVIGWPLHGLVVGQPVQTYSSASMPTGLVAGTVYYVIAAGFTANAFQISATHGGAAINTSSNGSGTFTGYCDVAAGIGTAEVGAAGLAIAHATCMAAYSNGTDHFEVIYFGTSDDALNDITLDGNPAHTHFSGHWIGP
jgi:hypothetical protein